MPTHCDICFKPLRDQQCYYDCKTNSRAGYDGAWAFLCPECFRTFGSNLWTKHDVKSGETLERCKGLGG